MNNPVAVYIAGIALALLLDVFLSSMARFARAVYRR